jgi:hypothetical protein
LKENLRWLLKRRVSWKFIKQYSSPGFEGKPEMVIKKKSQLEVY